MVSDQLTQLAARWRTAEQQLYPSLFADERLYERVLNVVGQLADELSDCTSEEALLSAYEQRQPLLERATRQLAGEAGAVDPEMVVASAFRLRHDTLRKEARWREAGEKVATARESRNGHGQWVTLFTRGTGGSPPVPPSEWLDAYLPGDGPWSVVPALHTWVGLDPDSDGPRYGVAVLSVDVTTEMPRPLAEPLEGPQEFTSEEEWQATTERLRSWARTLGGSQQSTTVSGR